MGAVLTDTRRRWFIRVEWKPQDLWVGAFWKSLFDHASYWPAGTPTTNQHGEKGRWIRTHLDVYVCLLPMVPLHFGWVRR